MSTANANALSIIETVKSDPMVIETQNRLNEVKAIHQAIFQKGVHYGAPYKGAKNDTLLKPGATFLQQKYALHELHERLETTIHVDSDDLSKSYIIIQDRCRIVDDNGRELAQCDAACTTFEDKYLFRQGAKVCPQCGGEFIIKSKEEYGGGWLCYKAKGGCGAKFGDNDPAITDRDTEKKLNSNPLNLLDTIVAMAQKRAAVRATIKATGVDALFSPGDGVTVDYYDDLEDSSAELLTVVAKNAPESHQDAPESHQDARTADLQLAAGSFEPAPQNAVKSPVDRFKGNGAPPAGQKKESDGAFVYRRAELFMQAGMVKSLKDIKAVDRNKVIIEMEDAGAFKDAQDYQQCIELVIARIKGEVQS